MRHAFGAWRAAPTTADALDALRPELGEGPTWSWAPQGLSATYVTAARTVVIHTWPERSVATIDAWGERAEAIVSRVAARLGWVAIEMNVVERAGTTRRRAVGA